MRLLLEVLSLYALYSFTVGAIVLRVQRRDRFSSFVLAILFPLLCVVAFLYTLVNIKGLTTEVQPPPPGLEDVEKLIELQRQKMFNSRPIEPQIAKRWKRAYAMSLELQAIKLRKFSLHIRQIFAFA